MAQEDTLDIAALGDAASLIRENGNILVFTGAGISVESGVPPFRGPDGLWVKHDPSFIELGRFMREPEVSWPIINELFFDAVVHARPNPAHFAIVELEKAGLVRAVVTQNIDGLHQAAGSEGVLEFHGTTRTLHCLTCGAVHARDDVDFTEMPPSCGSCGGILKPDFVFFNEAIPEDVAQAAFDAAEESSLALVIGTMGEVLPAAHVPLAVKRIGKPLVEVNTVPSTYTDDYTDIFLQGAAGNVLPALVEAVLGK
ncbi:RNA polymerase subunit sigma [bacterium]|nr:RNA polymerase subunit sigma [bacterium]